MVTVAETRRDKVDCVRCERTARIFFFLFCFINARALPCPLYSASPCLRRVLIASGPHEVLLSSLETTFKLLDMLYRSPNEFFIGFQKAGTYLLIDFRINFHDFSQVPKWSRSAWTKQYDTCSVHSHFFFTCVSLPSQFLQIFLVPSFSPIFHDVLPLSLDFFNVDFVLIIVIAWNFPPIMSAGTIGSGSSGSLYT